MKASRHESKKQLFNRSVQNGYTAFFNYAGSDYEALADICNAVHLMSESTSLLPSPHRMRSYFTGEDYSRLPCLILADQDSDGTISECTLISKRDLVLFFRAHLFHGSDSHNTLRSDTAKRKMNLLSRYCDEDSTVALVFADGLNFVETPFIALEASAQSKDYPGRVGHSDTSYTPYVHKKTWGENEVDLGILESVTLYIFLEVLDVLKNTNQCRKRKIILVSNWHETPYWASKLSSDDRRLISQLMKHYSVK